MILFWVAIRSSIKCNSVAIFVMRSNNIINGSSLDYHNNIVSVNKQILTEQQLQTGDIVICMANGSSSLVGKSSFYDGDCSTPITVGAFCGIYRSKEPIVKWLFQTNKYRRYIWNSLQGGNGAIANLNGDDILRMSFSIPATPAKDNRIKLLTSVDTLLKVIYHSVIYTFRKNCTCSVKCLYKQLTEKYCFCFDK